MEFEEKLIALVHNYQYLYNTKSRQYKNIIQRDSAWATIAKEVDRPVNECKQRWKSLRDRYVRERKKMQQPSGSGTSFRPEWEMMSSLRFLDAAIEPRKQTSNFDEPFDEDNLFETEETPSMSSMLDSSLRGTPESIPPQKRKRRCNSDQEFGSFLGTLSQTLEKRFMQREENDDNYFYLKMLGVKMKQLPEHVKILVQEKFFKEVNDEILKLRNLTEI